VVVLLIVVIVAAFLIIRRLKHVEDVMESKRGSSTGKKTRSQSQAQMEHYGRQLHSDMDDMSVDPLMVPPPHTTGNSSSGTPQPDNLSYPRGRSDSTGYNVTPSPNMFDRHASPDSNVGGGGYFDDPMGRVQNIPGAAAWQQQNMPPMQAARIRGSMDSVGTAQQRPYAYTHWRQQSNASELSADGSENGAGVNSPLVGGGGGGGGARGRISELDGSGFVELPSSDGAHGSGPGVGYVAGGGTGVRSRSSSAASARGMGHARRRSDGIQGQVAGQGQAGGTGLGLTPLDEAAEMHGYYGRRDQQAGQTAAGLDVQWDVGGVGGYHDQGQQEGRGA
jgi:hypothetical protein